MSDIKYDTYNYYDGEIQNVKPEQIAAVIDAVKPVVVSVRCNGGDGAYDVAIANGAYIPLKPIVGFEHCAFANAPRLRKAVTRDIMKKISGAYALDA